MTQTALHRAGNDTSVTNYLIKARGADHGGAEQGKASKHCYLVQHFCKNYHN